MTDFVASNGIRVYLDEHGGVEWSGGSRLGEPKNVVTQAFREFFQAERDSELGRWRSKEHPEYVVYLAPECTDYDLRIMCETSGDSMVYTRSEDDGSKRDHPWESTWARVARAYFAAHPEPKPWHDAKPGEVWALKLDVIDAEYAYVRTDGLRVTTENGYGWKNLTPNVAPSHMGLTAPTITAGRKIWPEP